MTGHGKAGDFMLPGSGQVHNQMSGDNAVCERLRVWPHQSVRGKESTSVLVVACNSYAALRNIVYKRWGRLLKGPRLSL